MTSTATNATFAASRLGVILLSFFLLTALFNLNSLYTKSITRKLNEVIEQEVQLLGTKSDNMKHHQFVELDYQLAKDQSYGFFQDISEANWKRLQQISREYQPHMYPDNPLKFTDTSRRGTTPSWYQTNYEPDFSCQFERRVGGNSNGDGPKWVCDPHRITEIYKQRQHESNRKSRKKKSEKCLVYSIGSNGDFQFESGLQQLLGPGICEVHIFDMDSYSREMEEWASRYNVTDMYFHQWGLTTSAAIMGNGTTPTGKNATTTISPVSKDHKYRSISDIVKSLGHSDREQIDIFKIDCESCEWDTFEEWLDPATMPRLQQILIELHRSPPTKVLPFFDTLRAKGYVTFHKEPNIQHSQGNCIEYAFLKLAPAFFGNDTAFESF